MCNSAGTIVLTVILWGLILGCVGAILGLSIVVVKDALVARRERKVERQRHAEEAKKRDITQRTGLCRWCGNTHLDPWKYNYEPPTPFIYPQISYSCLLIGRLKRKSEAVEEAATRRRYRDDWHRNFESNHNIIWKRHLEAQVLRWLKCGETYMVVDWTKPKMRWHYGKEWPAENTVHWEFWPGIKSKEDRIDALMRRDFS